MLIQLEFFHKKKKSVGVRISIVFVNIGMYFAKPAYLLKGTPSVCHLKAKYGPFPQNLYPPKEAIQVSKWKCLFSINDYFSKTEIKE